MGMECGDYQRGRYCMETHQYRHKIVTLKKVTKNNKIPVAKKRNRTWTQNHIAIQDGYMELVKQNQRAPTLAQISAHSKLSMLTIQKHIRELKFEPVKMVERVLTPQVTLALFKAALKENIRAIELWYKLFEGYSERIQVETDHKIYVTTAKPPKRK